jgi:hypothetical protein
MHLMLLAGFACIACSIGTPGTIGARWYNLVAASAAGGVPFCDQQRSLNVGSYLGRQCHSCCEQTCLRVTIPPPSKGVAGAQLLYHRQPASHSFCTRVAEGLGGGDHQALLRGLLLVARMPSWTAARYAHLCPCASAQHRLRKLLAEKFGPEPPQGWSAGINTKLIG